MDAGTRRRAAEALRAIKRGGEGWFSLSEAVMGRPAPRDEVVARLADLIDTGEDTTVDAYDLLPVEDREALRWVHGHGGLNEVRRDYQDAYNRRSEMCAALGVDDDMGWSDAMAEMVKRLMPEGMEWLVEVWPKWSNGEYCKFGDWWKSDKYGEPEPRQFRKLSIYTPDQLREWGQDDGESYGYEWDFMRPSDPKYRPDKVEPPAPKVLDADGAEIREGDTVWLTDGRGPWSVSRTVYADRLRVICDDEKNGHLNVFPENITHRAPARGW